MTGNGADVANVVRDTIYRATLLLDDQKWEQWLDLCDDSFHYAIKSFSPEINRDMECKSVITRPSGGMKLSGPGVYPIEGFAWSGNGTIKAVDVTFDGGKSWREAALEEPFLDRCLTRFRYVWEWDGGPAKIASRAVDSTGYVQPTVAQIAKGRALVGFVQHHNGIFPWSVSASGEVKNAIV